MSARRRHLVVLESPWEDEDDNLAPYSMRPFVEGLCELYDFRLIYRTFTSGHELRCLLSDEAFDRNEGRYLVYITCHGVGGRLAAGRFAESNLNLAASARCLQRGVEGVWLSACEAGNGALEEFCSGGGAVWAGGYSCSVDWGTSMVIDLAILQSLMESKPVATRGQTMKAFVDALKRFAPNHEIGVDPHEDPVCLAAGFRLIARDQIQGSRARNITAELLEQLEW